MQQPSPQPLTDEQLALRVQAGDRVLWRELAERVVVVITRIVRHKVRQDDREDVTQDVLIRFYNALPGYSPDRGKVVTFVQVLAHSQIADYYRRKQKDPDIEDIENLADILEEASAHANPGPDLIPELAEHAGDDWPIIQMRMDGHQWDQIAAELALNTGQAKMRMKRALDALRKYLEGHGD